MPFFSLFQHRYLLGQLVKRDVLLRYRGAMFGVAWIFLSPLLMLAIFAFVFGHIFPAHILPLVPLVPLGAGLGYAFFQHARDEFADAL